MKDVESEYSWRCVSCQLGQCWLAVVIAKFWELCFDDGFDQSDVVCTRVFFIKNSLILYKVTYNSCINEMEFLFDTHTSVCCYYYTLTSCCWCLLHYVFFLHHLVNKYFIMICCRSHNNKNSNTRNIIMGRIAELLNEFLIWIHFFFEKYTIFPPVGLGAVVIQLMRVAWAF